MTELAFAFATVVGLMADFLSTRKADAATGFDEFMLWLSEQRHEELKSLIVENQATAVGIKALLHVDRREIMERLDRLDRWLASFASTDPNFAAIAASLRPDSLLSAQAIGLLQQMQKCGASSFSELRSGLGHLNLFDGVGGQLEYSEPQFIEDDLQSLLDLGLLRLTHNSTGRRVFNFTRAASELAKGPPGAPARGSGVHPIHPIVPGG